ncbi:MAG: ABC transporter permease subunit [Candidatus Latescibacteria bacterium]|nr:ABC transporter permease subunit [Candidatus Latescibacterota bacterium]
MIRTIMKREILDQLSGLKFTSILAVCSMLIILSIYTGAANYVSEQREYETTRRLARTELESYSSYADVGIQGVKVPKKPSPLSLIVSGVQGTFSKFVTVRSTGRSELSFSRSTENPIFAVFGDLDLSFIVKVILSLLVIMLTYDAISGEQERGTLKLVLSNPIPRVKVILAKMLSLLVCLLIAILPAVLVGLLIVSIVFNVHFTGEQWSRLGLIFGVYGLYLLLIFALGMFVSARTHRSSMSLLLLLLLWVIFVNVIPRTAVIVAKHLRPTPTYSEIQSKMEANRRERMEEFAIQVFKLTTSGQFGKGDVEALQQKMEGLREQIEEEIERDNAKITEDYERRKNNLMQLAVNLSRISPISAMSYAAMRLAGTGPQSHERFMLDINIYREALQRYVSEHGGIIGGQAQMIQRLIKGETQRPAPLDLSGLPVFREHPERLAKSIQHVLPDVVLLALGAAVLLMLAFLSFVRYEVQ